MWYYLYHTATGRLESDSSTPIDPVPAEHSVYERAERMNVVTERWNAVTRSIEARPAAPPHAIITQLNAALAVATTRINALDASIAADPATLAGASLGIKELERAMKAQLQGTALILRLLVKMAGEND
jgi:hypothetical protein